MLYRGEEASGDVQIEVGSEGGEEKVDKTQFLEVKYGE